MKKSLTCPKCDGRVLLHIERMRLPESASGSSEPARLPLVVGKGMNVFKPFGGFEAFICRSCGFTEWYADGADAIDPTLHPGVRIIDNTPRRPFDK